MFCINCGTKNDNNAKFCISCGTKMQAVSTVTQVAATPVEPVVSVEPE